MLLKELLNTLIRVELANIVIGKPEWSHGNFNYEQLISCVSSGYIELSKRFTLYKETVVIQPIEGRTHYPLDIKYAVSNTSSTEDKFIMDSTAYPFSNEIAKIDQMYDHRGNSIDFDTTEFNENYYREDYRTLVIKVPDTNHTLGLLCRAIPPPIVLQDEGELDTYKLDIPYQYQEALILYAAGRACSNRGAENATNNEGAIFMARFEASCAQISHLGLDTKENISNDKLQCRGFV